MPDTPLTDDPEPVERTPAGRPRTLYVPVRPGSAGCSARMFRTPLGERTAVGFTSADRLVAALGGGQPWVRLAATALRALTAPLGVARITVDPAFVAPVVTPVIPVAPVRAAALVEV